MTNCGFPMKSAHQPTLRTQIYTICQDYLQYYTGYQFSVESLLNENGYDLNELSAPELIQIVGKTIGLPYEITYLTFPYLTYFECDDPEPLSIVKFADIFIEIVKIYQTQLQEFYALPQSEQQPYYDKIYFVIKKYLPLKCAEFSPELYVNVGGYAVYGYQAKKMIAQVAVVMGLNKRNLCDAFDNNKDFNLPIIWYHVPLYLIWGGIFIVLGFLSFILHLLFYSVKWVITGKWDFYLPSKDKLTPMTAKEFADKIIGVWSIGSYYQSIKEDNVKGISDE